MLMTIKSIDQKYLNSHKFYFFYCGFAFILKHFSILSRTSQLLDWHVFQIAT